MANTSKQVACAFGSIATIAIAGVACGKVLPADEDGGASDSPPPSATGPEDATPGDTALSALSISDGDLDSPFSPDVMRYSATTSATIRNYFTVTATARDHAATIRVNGHPAMSGEPSAPIVPAGPTTAVDVEVTAPNASPRHYALAVSLGPANPLYIKASDSHTDLGLGRELSASGDRFAVLTYESVYIFVREKGAWREEQKVQLPRHTRTGRIALSGDTVAIPYSNLSDPRGQGSVWIYRRTGLQWSEEAVLKPWGAAVRWVGASVALDGDTLAVGSFDDSSAATGVNGDANDMSCRSCGSVYVFHRSGTGWEQEAYLKASHAAVGAPSPLGPGFGWSVALRGNRLVVGAPYDASSASGINGDEHLADAPFSGASFIFERSGGTWHQIAYVKPSNNRPACDMGFGANVSLTEGRFAVSALGEASAGTGVNGDQDDQSLHGAGAVYVFAERDGAWSQEAYVKASRPFRDMWFGESIAITSSSLAVGASAERSRARGLNGDDTDASLPSAGAAYVFTRDGATWRSHAYVKASNTRAYRFRGGPPFGPNFGRSVAHLGDAFIFGAISEASDAQGIGGPAGTDASARDSGAVYIYH